MITMIATRLSAIVLLLVATAHPQPATHNGYYYLDPSQLNLTQMLPPPPDLGSTQARNDEQQVAAALSARTPAEINEAKAGSARSVFFFEPSIGPNFTPARLPVTAKFFSQISSDVQRLVLDAKDYWQRPRPDGAGKKHGAYPSGHAAFAASAAIVLALLVPQKRDAIFSQARIFAANRILLGLHYPTDIASGWTAGTLAVYVMMHDRRFQHDFAAAKAELRRVRVLAAQGE
jgi:acid phosphatase (class A)